MSERVVIDGRVYRRHEVSELDDDPLCHVCEKNYVRYKGDICIGCALAPKEDSFWGHRNGNGARMTNQVEVKLCKKDGCSNPVNSYRGFSGWCTVPQPDGNLTHRQEAINAKYPNRPGTPMKTKVMIAIADEPASNGDQVGVAPALSLSERLAIAKENLDRARLAYLEIGRERERELQEELRELQDHLDSSTVVG